MLRCSFMNGSLYFIHNENFSDPLEYNFERDCLIPMQFSKACFLIDAFSSASDWLILKKLRFGWLRVPFD